MLSYLEACGAVHAILRELELYVFLLHKTMLRQSLNKRETAYVVMGTTSNTKLYCYLLYLRTNL